MKKKKVVLPKVVFGFKKKEPRGARSRWLHSPTLREYIHKIVQDSIICWIMIIIVETSCTVPRKELKKNVACLVQRLERLPACTITLHARTKAGNLKHEISLYYRVAPWKNIWLYHKAVRVGSARHKVDELSIFFLSENIKWLWSPFLYKRSVCINKTLRLHFTDTLWEYFFLNFILSFFLIVGKEEFYYLI